MKITMEMARAWGACSDEAAWFAKNFPDGGEYQAVLEETSKMEKEACRAIAAVLAWVILAVILLTAGSYNAPNRRK